jgi:hypothetical protein
MRKNRTRQASLDCFFVGTVALRAHAFCVIKTIPFLSKPFFRHNRSVQATMILSVQEVLLHGLLFLGVSINHQGSLGNAKCHALFKDMFGSTPEVLTHVWSDLMTTEVPNASCVQGEKTLKGFRQFLMANCLLYGYPRNATWLRLLFFPIGEKDTRGEAVWCWIRKIAALLPTKINFLDRWDDPDDETCELFIVGIDGTDCKIFEQKHEVFPMDRQLMSHKFKHAALKYEIGVAIYENKIVWVNGPFPGGRHDLTIFREDGLKDRMPEGKIGCLDRGYQTSRPDEVNMLATPQIGDDPELHKFMSRVRCRTETVMGRLKNFNVLSETFHHGPEKHECAFKACAVIVQYQIDHGAYLYEV